MNLQDLYESQQSCPECGGPAFSDLVLAEKKDACYSKVRSRYKVWPSAYASGALVQCRKKGAANWGNKSKNESVAEDAELAEEFDIIERVVEQLAEHNDVDAEVIWEDLESLSDDELYVFAVTMPLMEDWQKANKKDRTDGMSRKAVKAYRREHPGSKLKTAVTTKPSKLKKGSKASKRRKSYCSRSRGQMKMHSISCAKTPDKAICKARRRWNCESVDRTDTVIAEAGSPAQQAAIAIAMKKAGKKPQRTDEFASGPGGGSGDYLRALASAWYNGVFDTGSLGKGIKSQEDVERLLRRGIVCADGKTRKYNIDYSGDFDGVQIYSDDYYEHGDVDGSTDTRTGRPFGPYEHIEFKGQDLDEGVEEAFIAPALSAANANAEHRRQGAAGGGYRGRIDMPVDSRDDYLAVGQALKRAAAAAGQKIEYGRSGGVMSVFSDAMNSDELDQFIDNALHQGVAEGHETNAQEMARLQRELKATKDPHRAEYLRLEIRKLKGEIELRRERKGQPGVAEASLGDYRRKAGMQKAQAGMAAAFAPSAEQRAQALATFQKRERGLERVKARDEKARQVQQQKQIADTIARLPELKAEYEQMKARYQALGGSNWQYADREQNLTDSEREARAMEPSLRNLAARIASAEKHGSVSEGSQLIWKKPNQIRGSYTDQELKRLGFKYSAQFNKWGGTESQWAAMSSLNEVSDQTLFSYLTKVDADSRKHPADPSKRSPEKANKSVAGFSRAFNKLDARSAQALAPRVGESTEEDKARYEQAARDVVKGADPDHIARVRKLDPETLRKHVAYAWERVNSGEYRLNRPDLEESYGPPGSKSLGAGNFTTFKRHFQGRKLSQDLKLDMGNENILELPDQTVDALAEFYNNLADQAQKKEFIYDIMSRDSRLIAIMDRLGLPYNRSSAGGTQPGLLEADRPHSGQKKLDRTTVSDPRTAIAMRRAAAKYPSASSDIEAFIRQDIDKQVDVENDIDREVTVNRKQDTNLDRLKSLATKQNEKISQLDAENERQEQEINQLEKDFAALQKRRGKTAAPTAKSEPKSTSSAEPEQTGIIGSTSDVKPAEPGPEPQKKPAQKKAKKPVDKKDPVQQPVTQPVTQPDQFAQVPDVLQKNLDPDDIEQYAGQAQDIIARAKQGAAEKQPSLIEVSKQTLADYLHAAHKNIVDQASSKSFQSGQAGHKYNKADVSPKERQREKGMQRALQKLSLGEAWARRYPNIHADIAQATSSGDTERLQRLTAIKEIIDSN